VQGSDHRAAVKAQEKLRDQLAPRYQWLFTHMGRLEGGVKFLVDLRTDVLVRFLILYNPVVYNDIFSFSCSTHSTTITVIKAFKMI